MPLATSVSSVPPQFRRCVPPKPATSGIRRASHVVFALLLSPFIVVAFIIAEFVHLLVMLRRPGYRKLTEWERGSWAKKIEAFVVFVTVYQCLICMVFVGALCCFMPYAWPILLTYTAWAVLLDKAPQRGGRSVKWARNLPIWNTLKNYFPVTLVLNNEKALKECIVGTPEEKAFRARRQKSQLEGKSAVPDRVPTQSALNVPTTPEDVEENIKNQKSEQHNPNLPMSNSFGSTQRPLFGLIGNAEEAFDFDDSLQVPIADILHGVDEDHPDERGGFLFVFHPHGVLVPFSAWTNFVTNATGFHSTFPDLDMRVVTLRANFNCPIWREWMMAMGFCDASAVGLRHLLSSGPNKAALLVVGGAAESLHALPGYHDLTLNSRKGFCKIALQTGATIVPVFGFGEEHLYENLLARATKNDPVHRFATFFQRSLGFVLPVLHGRGVLQYSFGFLPRRYPLVTVVGDPMRVRKVAEPSQAQIDSLHTAYKSALISLYDRYKDTFDRERTQGLRFTD